MAQQIPVDPAALVEQAEADAPTTSGIHEVLPDLAYRRLAMVNVVFVGHPQAGDRGWVLVDAGIPATKGLIKRAAAARFGEARPSAIVLTHGHFDHVGVLEDLAAEWDVPVYAHALERPYLDGSASYPPGDPTVGGGLMALLSPLYPTRPVDVGSRLKVLPDDGSVPPMPGWRWLHTPGHSSGHVSLWREEDKVLIVGDAFITVAGESAYATALQQPEVHGPPKYFTVDWAAARDSVRTLAALKPAVAIAGHGQPLQGHELQRGLERLASRFDEVAVPAHGRYAEQPARAEDGSAYR